MIDDLSKTLAAILSFQEPAGGDADLQEFVKTLKEKFPFLAKANIQFDRPADEKYTPLAPYALNLFLYDVRENLELRTNEPVVRRNNGEVTITRPPMRVACSYLITAWLANAGGTQSAGDYLKEQQLLGEALQVLAHYPVVPAPLLQGELAQPGSLSEQELPLPLMISPADALKDPAEFWTAIGGKLRPSFTVTLTVAMPKISFETATIVKARQIRLEQKERSDEPPTATIAGRVTKVSRATDAGGAAVEEVLPVAEAVVTIAELNLSATTNVDGRYSFEGIPAKELTLRVEPGEGNPGLEATEIKVSVSAGAEIIIEVKLSQTEASPR
ncbi:MAG TPA: Pvc16 family protein [Pyrinomonadaceae bacterium]